MELTLEHGAMDRNRNAARTQRRIEHIPHFIGVDGEGVPNGHGGQNYVLLGVGERQIENPAGLTFDSIASYLYQCFRDSPGSAFVGYYLGYDFAHWLKGIPEDRARILLTADGIASRKRTKSGGNPLPFPVRYHGWEFDILANKRFKLRPQCCDDVLHCEHTGAPWMYICDAGPFFQTSLLKAIDPGKWKDDPIVTDEEYEELVAGKTSRGAANLDNNMRRYNALENTILARLMGKQADGLSKMGVKLKREQWFGPGQVSAAWMKKVGVPPRKDRREEQGIFQELARRSYYGGWFEIFAHGKIPGKSYGYDINSAYPHIMSTLPCLLHGNYRHGVRRPPIDTDGIILCKATIQGSDGRIGAGPHRSSANRISRPMRTRGYFWQSELEAGYNARVIDGIEYEKWWSYEPCNCPSPLAALSDLYHLRREVGKDTSLGKAAKLVYNSAYGKFAQSVGDAPYGNWVYASLTTSGCRSIILDAIRTHPGGTRDALMVATDGIFFRNPHPTLPLSESLGEWQETTKLGLCLFKPGFYWDEESKGLATYRSRGIRATDFAKQIPTIEAQFEELRNVRTVSDVKRMVWPAAEYNVSFAIISPLVALQRGQWEIAGKVLTDQTYMQDSNPRDKRLPIPFIADDILRTRAYKEPLKSPLESQPYEKRYGNEDPFSDETLESYGICPDGPAITEWQFAMGEFRRDEV